jgi:hypothetical protein
MFYLLLSNYPIVNRNIIMKQLFMLIALLLSSSLTVIAQESEKEDRKVYDLVEQMPTYPGGQSALFQWLSHNIKYPVEANVFNDSKVNAIDVIRFWSDYLYCGYPPKWIYTSVTSKKTKSKDEITKEDIKLYKSHFNITDKQYDDAMRFYPKELIDDVKELRDYFKKLKGGSNEE